MMSVREMKQEIFEATSVTLRENNTGLAVHLAGCKRPMCGRQATSMNG